MIYNNDLLSFDHYRTLRDQLSETKKEMQEATTLVHRVKHLDKRIEELEEKVWSLENPKRFRLGDKVWVDFLSDYHEGIVIDVKITPCGYGTYQRIYTVLLKEETKRNFIEKHVYTEKEKEVKLKE